MDPLGENFSQNFTLFFNNLLYFNDYLDYYNLENPIDTNDNINDKNCSGIFSMFQLLENECFITFFFKLKLYYS